MNTDAYSTAQVAEFMVTAGVAKKQQHDLIQFLKAVVAGVFLSFGGTLSLIAGSSPELQSSNPGLAKIISALVFPIGLVMIVLQQQELVTSNMMSVMFSTLKRKTPIWYYPWNITVVFFGNLCGALFMCAILVRYTGVLSTEPYKTYAINFARTKAVVPKWHQIFLRGIACNWLVCIAVYQAAAAREVISKIVAAWIPIFLFVGCGFDHVVANMLFIPIGIMLGEAPPLTAGYYIWKSMIPSFIGNVIGAWFVALPFTLFYLTKFGSPDAAPAGDLENVEAQVESGKFHRGAMPAGTPASRAWPEKKRAGSEAGTVVERAPSE